MPAIYGPHDKTPLGAVFPSVHAKVQSKQEAMKKVFDQKARPGISNWATMFIHVIMDRELSIYPGRWLVSRDLSHMVCF